MWSNGQHCLMLYQLTFLMTEMASSARSRRDLHKSVWDGKKWGNSSCCKKSWLVHWAILYPGGGDIPEETTSR